jgi:LCP family protein required for cell wall assembly
MSAGLEELEEVFRATRPHTPRRRRAKRRSWIWIVAIVTVVVVLPIGLIGSYLMWLGSTFDGTAKHLEKPFPAEAGRPAAVAGATNMLLIGSDSRDGLGDVTSGDSTGQRSDTLMLVHIPADRQGIVIVSLMRDLWVPVPGHGTTKLNAAFSHGGVPLTVATVESLLGARIDHVLVADFAGFGSIASALGGVEVWSDVAFTSKNMPGHSYARGYNTLSGDAALAFVRERYAFANADFQRVKNQQAFIRGVVNGFADAGTLVNPVKSQAAVAELSRYVTVDAGLTSSVIGGLAFDLRGLSNSDIHTLTIPTSGTGTSPEGQSIVIPDGARIDLMVEALEGDRLVGLIDSGRLDTEGGR